MGSADDMRDTRMPSRSERDVIAPRRRTPFDDDDDVDVDAEYGPGGFGRNTRNTGGFGGNVGSIGGNMEGMSGDSGIMRGMMMNRMGGMMTGGLMGGVGDMVGGGGMGGGGIGPVGLMGSNLDGLSRLANDIGQMNAMRGNLQGMAGAERNMRRPMPGADGNMRRPRESMERGRRSDGRMGRGEPVSRRDTSAERHSESDSSGTVVLVSNMNHQVCNKHTHTLCQLLPSVVGYCLLFSYRD